MAITAAYHWVSPTAACCTLKRFVGTLPFGSPSAQTVKHVRFTCVSLQPKTLQACMRSGCSTGTGRELSSLFCLRHWQPAVTILMLAQRGRGKLPIMSCQCTVPAASCPRRAPCLPATWLSCCRLGWLSRANSGPPAQLDFVYHQDNANMPIHYLATGPTGWCVHLGCVSGHHTKAPVHFCLSSRT